MAIESILERIATALEILAEQHSGLAAPDKEPSLNLIWPRKDAPVDEQGPSGNRAPSEPTIVTGQKAVNPNVAPETPAPAKEPETSDEPFVGLDASNRPWDARIDSSNGKKTGKGVWQARRNIAPEVRKAVILELMAAQAAGVAVTSQTPAAEPVLQTPAPVAQPETAQPIPAAFTPPAAVSAATIVPTTLAELQHVAQGVLQQLGPNGTKITDLLTRWQVDKLSLIPVEYYPQFHSELLATLDAQ